MKEKVFNNDWRKVAAAIYRKPVDSKVFGSVEMDVADLEEYIGRKRKEGLKITLTHVFLLAVARAIRYEVPVSNVAFVFVMGGVTLKPAVIGDQIVPGRIISLSTSLNHRVVGAFHGGKLFRYLKQIISNPQILEDQINFRSDQST